MMRKLSEEGLMGPAEKKIIKLIKVWIIPNVVESLILILILLMLTKDPKNAWLFGYSKSRIFILGGVLLYMFLLFYLFHSLSSPPKVLKKALQIITSHPHTQGVIDFFGGLCTLMLFASGYYFYSILATEQMQEDFLIRLIPILIFIWVVFLQVLISLIILRRILKEDKPTSGREFTFRTISQFFISSFNQVDSTITNISKKVNRSLLTFIFILTPAILSLVLIWLIFGTTPLSYMPARSDQLYYWHEALTYVDHGFSGGYYSLNERIPLAEFSAFGFHGPAYPVLYGSLGRIVGWEYYTGVLINFFVITLALFLFTRLSNLDNKQLLIGIFLIGTYWPMILYLSDNMTESINQAIAILLSVLFFKQLDNQKNDWKINIAIFLILLISISFRVTWSLLFFPFFFFLIFNYRGYKILAALVLSTAGVLLGFLYTKYFYYPFPDIFRSTLHGQFNLQELVNQVGIQVHGNLNNLIDEPDTPFYIQAFRYQIVGMTIVLVFKLISYFKEGIQAIKSLLRSELGFHFLNIVVPFASVLFIYYIADTRDYRNLAHNFLLSALFLLLFTRYKYIYPIVMINMLLIFSFIPDFAQERSRNFIYDRDVIISFSNSITEQVKFDETQSDRWCNTLGFNGKYEDAFVAIDSGIGLAKIDNISEDTKPKYLLLSDTNGADFQVYIDSLGIQKLEETNIGVLFLNSNSGCE